MTAFNCLGQAPQFVVETLAMGASPKRPQADIQVVEAEAEIEVALEEYSFKVVERCNPATLTTAGPQSCMLS